MGGRSPLEKARKITLQVHASFILKGVHQQMPLPGACNLPILKFGWNGSRELGLVVSRYGRKVDSAKLQIPLSLDATELCTVAKRCRTFFRLCNRVFVVRQAGPESVFCTLDEMPPGVPKPTP